MTTTYRMVYTSPPNPITWFYNPSDEDCGGMMVINNLKGEIILPLGQELEEGWNLHIRQEIGPGGAKIRAQFPDSLAAQAGTNDVAYTGEGKSEIIRGGPNTRGGFTYVVGGNVFNSGLEVVDEKGT